MPINYRATNTTKAAVRKAAGFLQPHGLGNGFVPQNGFTRNESGYKPK
jgi:hypothetical protein